MEHENNSSYVGHKPPPLNSDQLNYLIWRYLQEAGYAEAAVKLQRDWKVDTESLPFAKHIKGQALVNLVQKGLKFHHLSLTFDENGQQTRPLVPSMFYFGPECTGAEGATVERESLLKVPDFNRGISPASTTANTARSKARDTASVAPEEAPPPAAKRGRKPGQTPANDRNGVNSRKVSGPPEPDAGNASAKQSLDRTSPAENAGDETSMLNGNHDDRMDVDHDTGAEPADVAMEEQTDDVLPPLIPTLTNGESRAVQVIPAKVANLASSSAVLSLDPTQSIDRTLWQPVDAATLVAQSDRYCGYWNLTGQALSPESVKPLPSSLFSSDEVGLVTAAAWNSDGSILAVATFAEGQGQIHLFEGQDLTFVESLPASQREVTILKWHSANARLIGISPDDDEQREGASSTSTLLCWDLTQGQGPTELSILTIPSTLFDVDTNPAEPERAIYAAGESAIYRCSGVSQLKLDQQWTSPVPHDKELWTFIKCAGTANATMSVVVAAAETATLWLPGKEFVKTYAHDASITALEVRPTLQPANGAYPAIQFATSSDDGTIKVWETRDSQPVLSCVHQLRFAQAGPIMSLAYSPDSFCLAGAGYTAARIWNAQHEYNLMAAWDGSEPEWRGSSIRDDELASSAGRTSINGDNLISAQHSLTWHSDSKRLAFGLGSQVAVINFQR